MEGMLLPPLAAPDALLADEERTRTARHLALAGFGEEAQRRLASARVTVIGAGGLGSPVILALAAAGVGTITVIDDDAVELSNLQRQIIHRRADVGRPKVDSAIRVARDLAVQTTVRPVAERLTAANAAALLGDAQLVIDGSDTFATRVDVAAACEALGIPLVWGVIQEFHAQLTVFWSAPPAPREPVVLADLYPPGSVGEPPSCAQVGVLGSLCLQIGGMLATEAIKLLAGLGEPLLGRVLVVDALRATTREIPLRPSTATAPLPEELPVPHVDAEGLARLRADGAVLVDVREPEETATGVIPGSVLIPLDVLLAGAQEPPGPRIVLVCQAGARALRAARALQDRSVAAVVLTGGIGAWDGPLVAPALARPTRIGPAPAEEI